MYTSQMMKTATAVIKQWYYLEAFPDETKYGL